MKLNVGEDPKTGVMVTIEVTMVPCPDAANPEAVETVDAKGRVWGWYKWGTSEGSIPSKGTRRMPIRGAV